MSKVQFSKLDDDFAYIEEGTTLVQRHILCLTSYFPDGMRYNNKELGKFFQLSPERISRLISKLKEQKFIVILFEQSKYRAIFLNENHSTLMRMAKYHKDLHCCRGQSKTCLHCLFGRSTLMKRANSIKRNKKKENKEGKEPMVDNFSLSIISTKPKAENNAKSQAVSPEEFMDCWNAHETLLKIHTFTDQRKKALVIRRKEPVFVDNWERIIDKASQSLWHTGRDPKSNGWRATVDWLLKNNTNYVKILELAEPEFGSRAVTEEEAEELMKEVRKYENE